ncbi:MAG: hypothetical protein HAW59_05385, partial [Betaproteobacteria bacterium]|nr:hypothetical protein [Betaproteobacteria bacterium]
MKNIALVFFAGFLLSACGGGGGGIPMTPPSAPAISHSEQTQLIAAAAGLRAEVAALPSSPEKSALIARIESLEKNISSLQQTLA